MMTLRTQYVLVLDSEIRVAPATVFEPNCAGSMLWRCSNVDVHAHKSRFPYTRNIDAVRAQDIGPAS